MRTIGSALVATTLLVTSAFAATDSVAPSASNGALAPGKPAGVQKAQGADNTIWWVLGAGVVIGGIVLVATGNGNDTPPASTNLTQ
jgi:hypothetical protein